MRRLAWVWGLFGLMAAGSAPGRHEAEPAGTPFDLCERAVAQARFAPVPATLLASIARVESGRPDPATGLVRPWPWTINVGGAGRFFADKAEAVAAVQAIQAGGIKSVDVGCMQVNLLHHPAAFANLDAAFDPPTNAAYAARYLRSLYAQAGGWALATAWYHSQTQELGEAYQRRVFGQGPASAGAAKPAGPYAPWPPPGVKFGAIPPQAYAFGAFAGAPSGNGAFGAAANR